MKIVDARVIVTCPGRNFVTLKIVTDNGLDGIGDATLNGRELAVVSYLQDHVIPCLLGRDASQIEDIWQFLYRGAYWRGGPVTMSAISAVDTALWDIKAKTAGMPLYQLLGGKCREAAACYSHASGNSKEETLDAVHAIMEEGYHHIRVQIGGYGGLDSTRRGLRSFRAAPGALSRLARRAWVGDGGNFDGRASHLRVRWGACPHAP